MIEREEILWHAARDAAALRERVARLEAGLATARAQLANQSERVERWQARAHELTGQRDRLAQELRALKASPGWRVAALINRVAAPQSPEQPAEPVPDPGPAPAAAGIPEPPAETAQPTVGLSKMLARADAWLAAARTADLVIVVGAAGPADRHALDRAAGFAAGWRTLGAAVLLAHDRPPEGDPAPEGDDPLLAPLPADQLPRVVDRVLDAPLDGRRGLLALHEASPLAARLITRAVQGGWRVVFDRSGRSSSGAIQRYLDQHADLVIARDAAVPGTLVVPDGGHALPECLPRQGNRITIGLLGNTDLDWGLVVRAAEAHPDWRFELVGAPAPAPPPPNVLPLGDLGPAALAALRSGWTAAALPATAATTDPAGARTLAGLGLPALLRAPQPPPDTTGLRTAASSDAFLAELAGLPGQRPAVLLPAGTWQARARTVREAAANASQTRPPLWDLLRT